MRQTHPILYMCTKKRSTSCGVLCCWASNTSNCSTVFLATPHHSLFFVPSRCDPTDWEYCLLCCSCLVIKPLGPLTIFVCPSFVDHLACKAWKNPSASTYRSNSKTTIVGKALCLLQHQQTCSPSHNIHNHHLVAPKILKVFFATASTGAVVGQCSKLLYFQTARFSNQIHPLMLS